MLRRTPHRDALDTIGRAVLALRTGLGWTQAELAIRADTSQPMVSAVERCKVGDVTFETAWRLLNAMGARVSLSIDPPYLGDRAHQRDAAHARCTSHVGRRLERAGWIVAREVEVGGDRSRGWIDILAYHPPTGLMLVIEVKTELHDLGQIERSLGWYEREAWASGRRLGWRPRRAVGILLLLATEANDERLRSNREAVDAGFPLRAGVLSRLVDGEELGTVGRGLAMIDPSSRRQMWLRPSRLDGRRSPAPYSDYAGFMRAAHRRKRSGRYQGNE
jgi:transcriptional regulator with XRE-family HTH domain